MSLRRRLVLAVVALVVTVVVAGGAVLVAQRQYTVRQVDEQLLALSTNPAVTLRLSARADSGSPVRDVLGCCYVGRLGRTGRLVTVLAPTDDPGLVPALGDVPAPGEPAWRPTADGETSRVRVVTATLATGATAVFAAPTTAADAATRRLAATLGVAALALLGVVGVAGWWVVRLGLRPLDETARAADAIAAGQTDRRVDPGPPGTEAARLAHALNALVDTTQAAGDRLRRFVADASHELRTPLTTLQGYSSLHGSGPVDEAARTDALRRINEEATRMRRIVDQLLQLATLDAAPTRRTEAVDLRAVLDDVAGDLRVVQPERPVSVEAPPGLLARADRDHVVQAVTALTANAMRHTPVTAAVTLAARRTAGGVRVEVADAGPGIASEHLPRLFDRFYRVDPGRSRAQGGSGLGLAVVESIARTHGGSAGVSSTPGAGSVFWVDLPASPPTSSH
ncbi:MAG TPA: ATP-binding protein [Pedococcus sp.]|jgi:two-component system OmpR family sensor kinase